MNRLRTDRIDDGPHWAAQMARVGTGDVDCFMAVYDHFGPRLHRYFLGLGLSAAQAEDLVQESMLRVWRHAARFDPARAGLSTWIFRIGRNLHIDGVRATYRLWEAEEGVDDALLERAEDPCDGPDAWTDHRRLDVAIDALPADQARLLRMSYLESKSHGEIARELGMPLGTVKSTLRRAFGKLKGALR